MAEIEARAGKVSAAKIHDHLVSTVGEARTPSLRTVQDIVREVTPDDETEAWSVGDDPEHAAVVVPVLGNVVARTLGQVGELTRLEAEWIVRLYGVAHDLPPWDAFQLARLYMRRVNRGEPTRDLDLLLALAPWGSAADCERYCGMVNERQIATAPPACVLSSVFDARWYPSGDLRDAAEDLPQFRRFWDSVATRDGQRAYDDVTDRALTGWYEDEKEADDGETR